MNKPDFQVVVPCYLLQEKELDVSLRAFHWFFNNVTHRHQRRSRLVAVGASTAQLEIMEYFWKKTGLAEETLVNFPHRFDAKLTDEAILVMPSQRVADGTRVELIHWQLPTIAFENWERSRTFDAGFCLFIPQNLEDQAVREFGSFIKMLYFDPGALSMQMLSLSSDNHGGLYFAADDSLSFRKSFLLWGEPDRSADEQRWHEVAVGRRG